MWINMQINRNWYLAEGARCLQAVIFSPLQGLFLFAPTLRDGDLTEKQRKGSSTNFGCIAFDDIISNADDVRSCDRVDDGMRDHPRRYDGTITLTRRE
jgi:hypothetical protein